MNALTLFQLASRLNTQNPYENRIRNEFRKINLYMNIVNSNWHIWSIDPTKNKYLLLLHFDTQLLTSSPLNSLLHNSKCEMARSEKDFFQLTKIRKMNISRNIKFKYVTDVSLSVGSSRMKFILVNRGWAHKCQTVT